MSLPVAAAALLTLFLLLAQSLIGCLRESDS